MNSIGPTGYFGSCGATGARGESGATGPVGTTGDVGNDGNFTETELLNIFDSLDGLTGPPFTAKNLTCNELLLRNDQPTAPFAKASVSQVLQMLTINGFRQLAPGECSSSNPGFGFRLRHLQSPATGQELFTGVADLGRAANRTSSSFTFNISSSEISSYGVLFNFDRPNAVLTTSLYNINNVTGSVTNQFSGFISNDSVVYETSTGTTGMTPLNSLNAISINVSNRQNNQPTNLVTCTNVVLGTSAGVFYQLNYNGAPNISPPNPTQITPAWQWPIDGSSPGDTFTLRAFIQLRGTFTSAEASKIEIRLFACDDL